MRFRTSVINGYLAWMPVGVLTNHGSSSVHVQLFSHQNGGADVGPPSIYDNYREAKKQINGHSKNQDQA